MISIYIQMYAYFGYMYVYWNYYCYHHHYLDSPPSSSPSKNRWSHHEVEIGIPPKNHYIFAKIFAQRFLVDFLHFKKAPNRECVLLVLVTTIHSRQVQLGKMQPFPGLGFGGQWSVVWLMKLTLNTWVLGVQKKLKYTGPVSFLGDFWINSAWFMVFQTFPPF